MNLPPNDSKFWSLAQQGLSAAVILFLAYHGLMDKGVAHMVTAPDMGDAVGGAVVLKEIAHFLKRFTA